MAYRRILWIVRREAPGFRIQDLGSEFRGWVDRCSKRLGAHVKWPKLHSGCRVQVAGFRVQGPGFRVQGAEYRVQSSRFRLHGSGFRVQGSEDRGWVDRCSEGRGAYIQHLTLIHQVRHPLMRQFRGCKGITK